MRREYGLLGETRIADDLPIACPAGLPIGETLAGAGCWCRVTQSEVLSATDPSSLTAFCLSAEGYQRCPVWRDDKERAWDQRESLAEAA